MIKGYTGLDWGCEVEEVRELEENYNLAIDALQKIDHKSVNCDLYDLKEIANDALKKLGEN